MVCDRECRTTIDLFGLNLDAVVRASGPRLMKRRHELPPKSAGTTFGRAPCDIARTAWPPESSCRESRRHACPALKRK